MNSNMRRTVAAAIACLMIASNASAETDAEDRRPAGKEFERVRTEKAINEAVQEALTSLEADNRLDLDIRLIGPNSITIAARGKRSQR
jgi:hypothetical protein